MRTRDGGKLNRFGRGLRGDGALLVLTLLLAAVPVQGADSPGLGELTLDQATVAAMIRGGMPGPIVAEVPGVGQVSLRLRAPRTVRFVEGGLEARVVVEIAELESELAVLLRYEPEVLTKSGRIRLRAVKATGEGLLSLLPDLAALMPAAEFPRGFDWLAPDGENPHTRMTLTVQDVTITDKALIVRFSLAARPHIQP